MEAIATLKIVAIVGLFFAGVGCQASEVARDGQRTDVLTYLTSLGNAADCWFTILIDVRTDAAILNRLVAEPERRQNYSIEQALGELRKTCPGMTIERSGRVIHLRQSSVGVIPFDHKIQVTYSGSANGLIDLLSRKGMNIAAATGTTSADPVFDLGTPVKVEVVASGRDILTQSLPIMSYRRVMWVGHMGIEDGVERVRIRLRGQDRKRGHSEL